MHGLQSHVEKYVQEFQKNAPSKLPCNVGIAAPFTLIPIFSSLLLEGDSNLVLGAQNLHEEEEGAFTGEISAGMLLDAGAQFVLIGHSERRRLFHEEGARLFKKVQRSLSAGLQPVLCLGETLQENAEGRTWKVLEKQLQEILGGMEESSAQRMILAYEPVWAIGTGKNASGEWAEEVHVFCREWIAQNIGRQTAANIPIIYGGSVNPQNADTFFLQKNIDGSLVGGASLEASSFLQIIQSMT